MADVRASDPNPDDLTPEEQAFWAESSHGSIAGELELHATWLTPETGISAATFAAEPSPVNTAYLDHLRAAAFSGDYAVLIAAILPCFWLYTDLGRRLHAGDFGAYATDPRHPYASWLTTYADPGFTIATERAIGHVVAAAAGADGERRRRMHRAFVAAAEHERAFFDLR